jgi:hypothetical protein
MAMIPEFPAPTLPDDPRLLRAWRVLRALAVPLRWAMRPHYQPGSAIAAVRCALDALEVVGVAARPLRVRVVVANAAYAAAMSEASGRPPRIPGEQERWERERGALRYTIGYPITSRSRLDRPEDAPRPGVPPPYDPAGLHLVAVAEEAYLLDPSLDQASRPDRGFVLDPLVAPVDGLFLLGAEPAAFVLAGGALANYQAVVGAADNRSYVHSPNWGARDAPIRRRIVEQALEALPMDLRAPPAGRDGE